MVYRAYQGGTYSRPRYNGRAGAPAAVPPPPLSVLQSETEPEQSAAEEEESGSECRAVGDGARGGDVSEAESDERALQSTMSYAEYDAAWRDEGNEAEAEPERSESRNSVALSFLAVPGAWPIEREVRHAIRHGPKKAQAENSTSQRRSRQAVASARYSAASNVTVRGGDAIDEERDLQPTSTLISEKKAEDERRDSGRKINGDGASSVYSQEEKRQ